MLRKISVLSSLLVTFVVVVRRPGFAALHLSLCIYRKESCPQARRFAFGFRQRNRMHFRK